MQDLYEWYFKAFFKTRYHLCVALSRVYGLYVPAILLVILQIWKSFFKRADSSWLVAILRGEPNPQIQ